MNKILKRRIADLEFLTVVGCESCRFWHDTVLRDDEGNRSRPESCPDCGRYVAITHELHIVGIPLDLL